MTKNFLFFLYKRHKLNQLKNRHLELFKINGPTKKSSHSFFAFFSAFGRKKSKKKPEKSLV